jgi:hypothetical protein
MFEIFYLFVVEMSWNFYFSVSSFVIQSLIGFMLKTFLFLKTDFEIKQFFTKKLWSEDNVL